MNYIWEVVGRHPTGQQPTGAETIQKLCDRVASSTLLEDRRDAVRALKSLSKKYRMEVGTMAMDHLVRILQTDRADTEILGYALDTLYNIVCSDEEEEPDDSEARIYLVSNVVFSHSIGVSRLMDLLADSREVIRNDGLLLLQQLTKGNTAIQKIVAFENAFERLLEIITEEGSSDGGIVVEDCLLLLLNLLKNNSSNQNFFKEGSYVQKMKPWFEVGDDNSGWSAQKVTNLHLMLQLVRVMVSPVNSPGATTSCQKAMFQCGLLQQLCTILMATGVPADILTETINTVSEVIRGSEVNQDYFASVNAPSNPPRPAIVVLLMSMVNERQPFVLRCAVLYCFQCFLYKNHKGQGEIVATLLPSTIDANSISAGQLLCGGLFSADSLSNWCAAVALAHALQDNLTQKEQLLRVQLATSLGKPPVSLLQQCTNILSQGDKLDRRVSISAWTVAASMITKAVLRSSEEEKKEEEVKKTLEQHDSIVTQYKELIREQDSQINELKEQVTSQSSQNEKLQNTITQQFSQIQQHKDQYNILKLKLGKDNQQTGNQAEAAHVNGVQPEELSQLREQLEELQRQNQLLQTQLTEKDSLITSLKAEGVPSAEGSTSEVTELQKEVELLKAQLQSQTAEITQLQSERQELLRGSETTAAVPGEDAEGVPSAEGSTSEVTELQKEVELLKAQLQSQTAEITQLQSERQELLRGSETTAAVPGEDGVYTEKIAELESRLSAQTAETQKLKGEVKTLLESKELMEKELASATSTAAIMLSEKSKLQQEVQESKKEQDDLLMLLADQDQKILSLKQRLKDLGETIEDEDDLDSRDQFDDDDEEEEEEECDE
ncbi:general vesicular transport factor p115 [Sinocyclocheilus grahami]|uniref:general vesicular transport factor p115 n=1 Tax=Sinocyclocheilus grahami TaxID=75366 RepID=UPI0007AD09E6|nr:PREDICTED: general vesicular transport factor p115 [Sinocyclocheilus grahami]